MGKLARLRLGLVRSSSPDSVHLTDYEAQVPPIEVDNDLEQAPTVSPAVVVPEKVLAAIDLRPEPAEMPEKAVKDEIAANEFAIRALQLRQYRLHLQKQSRELGE